MELLVALAIGSFVAIGLGELLSFGGELLARTRRAEAVEAALSEIASLALRLERLPRSTLAEAGEARFGLAAAATDTGQGRRLVEIEDGQLIVASGPDEPDAATADVSIFERASFDYLQRDGSATQWRTAEQLSGDVLAARLIVSKGRREWPFVLWVQPR